MNYYKTDLSPEGLSLFDGLNTLCQEGESCEKAAQALALELGAASLVSGVGSDYGGISALSFSPEKAHVALFDAAHILRPITDEKGNPILSDNGTPYFELNCDFHDHPTRYQRAQRMRHRSDVILSQGKLSLSAVINRMSRTEIIQEGLGRRPKFDNEYQILKFRYRHARTEAAAAGREAEEQWLKEYADLKTAADFRRVFPDISAGEAQQLQKSRAELSQAIAALEDTEWSIIVEIKPGERCTDTDRIYDLARRLYFLPVIHYGDTHRLLGATPSASHSCRPATFCLNGAIYVKMYEVAKADGLIAISEDEYNSAVRDVRANDC